MLKFHLTGIAADQLASRSPRAGGAMALFCGKDDFDHVKMLGRWRSDAKVRYLHLQAQPIMKKFAVAIFNDKNFTFLPEDTVPVADDECHNIP